MKIRLNHTTNKTSSNTNVEAGVLLTNEQRLLPVNSIDERINMTEVYKNEREESNLVRLVCTLNPVCANPIFNKSTEIVLGEGSDNCSVLTSNSSVQINGTYGKPKSFSWNRYEGTRDTQLSNDKLGYTYHCGYDIFNCHILRSRYFKSVSPVAMPTVDFNTLDDIVRDADGIDVDMAYDSNNSNVHYPQIGKERLYTKDDVYTFQESIYTNLTEKNGWFGFYNKAMLRDNGLKNDGYEFDRVINNRSANDFIEMYPDSTLYSFNPKYNKHRRRAEHNWKYYLTYPFSGTTEIYCIDQKTEGLLTTAFYDRGDSTTIYSMVPHGVKIGDTVNVYVDGELTYKNARVTGIGDGLDDNSQFVLTFDNGGDAISEDWIDIESCDFIKNDGSVYYQYNDEYVIKVYSNSTRGKYSVAANSGVTIGDEAVIIGGRYIPLNIVNGEHHTPVVSFKKTVRGCECRYYCRLFSKIPNWKVADKPDKKSLSRTLSSFIRFTGGSNATQKNKEQFSHVVSKLGFAKNIYGDPISQLIYNDDIDLEGLVDNLGRPVSDIYLTIVKNNAGYKEWYEQKNYTSHSVEYSHCFGKVTCGFINAYDVLSNPDIPSVQKTSYDIPGMNVNSINGINTFSDEIKSDEQCVFYGDICCFNVGEYKEEPLSDLYFRFNTAQREAEDVTMDYVPMYDEIPTVSGVTYNGILHKPEYISKTQEENNIIANRREYTREGYIYKAHHKIPIHGFSTDFEEQLPKIFNISTIITSGKKLQCTTTEVNYVEPGDELIVYNQSLMEYVIIKANKVNSQTFRTFTYSLVSGDINRVCVGNDLLLLRKDVTIPDYAVFVNDGTMRYIWRTFIKNGTAPSTNDTEYKFANGRFYVQDSANVVIRRQDPYEKVEQYSGIIINAEKIEPVYYVAKARKRISIDDFVEEKAISCNKN